MIWTTGPTGEVTYIGPEWRSFTGQASSQALGSGWLSMLYPDDRLTTEEFFREACSRRLSFTVQYRLARVDGTYTHVISGAAPSFSPMDGSFLGYLGSANEVVDLNSGLAVRRDIGRLWLPPPVRSTMPLALLDAIADNILMARAIAERAGETALYACLDLALTMAHARIGSGLKVH